MDVPTLKPQVLGKSWLTIVAIFGLLGLFGLIHYRFDVLYLGQGRLIVFFNDWYEIDSCLRRFQIRKNFIQLAYNGPSVEFCDEPILNDYAAISADNRNLIGILDYALDTPLFLMYDFTTDQCWPCGISDELRDSFFEHLKRENPNLQQPSYW